VFPFGNTEQGPLPHYGVDTEPRPFGCARRAGGETGIACRGVNNLVTTGHLFTLPLGNTDPRHGGHPFGTVHASVAVMPSAPFALHAGTVNVVAALAGRIPRFGIVRGGPFRGRRASMPAFICRSIRAGPPVRPSALSGLPEARSAGRIDPLACVCCPCGVQPFIAPLSRANFVRGLSVPRLRGAAWPPAHCGALAAYWQRYRSRATPTHARLRARAHARA